MLTENVFAMEEKKHIEQSKTILDGGFITGLSISNEAIKLKEKVLNKELSLIERLSAYEDIINLEIGDTSITRARNIERESGLRQIYLKFEGGNPSGTHKDRIAFSQCLDALRRGYDAITMASCGNYGVSMALASNYAGIRCLICIPESYHTNRIKEMNLDNVEIIRTKGSYEESVEYSKYLAVDNDYYDANPGGKNTLLQIQAYAKIAYEIYDVLRDAPKVVSVPVSNGTLLAGVHRGFENLFKRGKTSRIPIMIGASALRKNPIIESFKKKFNYCKDLNPKMIKESEINEPLINWHSFDGNEALWAIYNSKGAAFDISDTKLSFYTKTLKEKEGLSVLPASTAGLAGLLKMHNQNPFEGDRFVSILTSRK